MAGVKFIDNSALILNRIGTNSQQAMRDAADMLVEAVQEKIMYGYKDVHGNPPHTEIVDTGKLFDSIEADVKRDSQNAYSVTVGANTKYAQYVHDGTSKLKGRPFVRDGVMGSQKALQNLLSTDLSAGLKK